MDTYARTHELEVTTEYVEEGLLIKNWYTTDRMLINCHNCGRAFSPLPVKIATTDRREYFLGVYSRLCYFSLEHEEDMHTLCEHLQAQFNRGWSKIMMFDHELLGMIIGKVIEPQEKHEPEN